VTDSNKAVFLSYAKQDADAAARICDALRAAGVEVWFDQSELRGGDSWDAAIRRQIKTCALMIPVISANTQGRAEGYFRLEWKLAIDRSHLMSHDRPFLVPVVIDQTSEGDERVPEKFREVQWTRLPGGETSPAFIAQVLRLLDKEATIRPPVPPTVPAGRALAEASMVSAAPPVAVPTRKTPIAMLATIAVVLALGIAAWATHSLWLHSPSVVAYSNDDRRMTYAVLPFQAPAEDTHGVQVAKATGDELTSMLEARKELVSVMPRASAEQAVAHENSIKKLAKALNVHFLVRGTVARDGAGYKVTILGFDGESERILATQSLIVAADALTPRWRDDVQDVAYELVGAGLRAEVKAARDKPQNELDVRDLTFRAHVDWRANRDADGKLANANANSLLDKALALAPDDQFALRTRASINLCDCVNVWSTNPEEQKAIGAAAMEKYLRADPTSPFMLIEKAALYQLRLRWEESMVIADTVLGLEPDDVNALGIKAVALLRLGRAKEAQTIMDGLLVRYPTNWYAAAEAADVYFALGDYARAANLAKKATAQMSETDLRDRVTGPVWLTLIAAEAKLGHDARAKSALADFETTLPGVNTITAIKKWIHPSANLADFEPLYDGLRQAGVGA
jgi:tetratricopeptide (TPR) repeat protein